MREESKGDQPQSRSIELEPQEDGASSRVDSEEARQQRELLDQVIRETLSHTQEDFAVNSAEYTGLLQVGLRHRGKECDDSIVQELVDSLLERLFQQPALQPEIRSEMAQDIGSTLVEDPTSRDLLQQLWSDIQKKCDSK